MSKQTRLTSSDFKANQKKKARDFSIPQPVVCKLWSKAGGRCHLCNKPLYEDDLTFHVINKAHIAHILSWTPNGPRYEAGRSELLRTDFSNLMLVCMEHNKLFDVGAAVGEYTEKRLLEIKKEHECRIETATSIKPENKTMPFVYSSNIGRYKIDLCEQELRTALLPNFYPIMDKYVSLKLELEDTNPLFWETEKTNLEKNYKTYVLEKQQNGDIKHISIFAFAPQPLLIYLGFLISNKYPTEVYPLQWNPRHWGWLEDRRDDIEFIITKPSDYEKPPVLTISLSCKITEERVSNSINGDYSRWDITIPNPNPAFMRNKKYLYKFSNIIYELLDEIKKMHGENTVLNVIPVMPIVTAIEFGRNINSKYTMPIVIYNNNESSNKFEPVLNICLPKNRGDLN